MATLFFNCSCAVTTIVVYSTQLKEKENGTHTRQLEKVVIVTTTNAHTYIHKYSKEVLLTIRRKKCDDDDDRDFKCRICIRVGHEIQLNKNKDDEVIENDVYLYMNKEQKKRCRDICPY
jgi:hypothetical protein